MSTQRPAPDLFTLAEVAAWIGVTVQTVWRWVDLGLMAFMYVITGFRSTGTVYTNASDATRNPAASTNCSDSVLMGSGR